MMKTFHNLRDYASYLIGEIFGGRKYWIKKTEKAIKLRSSVRVPLVHSTMDSRMRENDFRVFLQRGHGDLGNIEEGSEMVYRPDTFWVMYRPGEVYG